MVEGSVGLVEFCHEDFDGFLLFFVEPAQDVLFHTWIFWFCGFMFFGWT